MKKRGVPGFRSAPRSLSIPSDLLDMNVLRFVELLRHAAAEKYQRQRQCQCKQNWFHFDFVPPSFFRCNRAPMAPVANPRSSSITSRAA